MRRYRIALTFTAPALTISAMRWAVRVILQAFSDHERPDDLRAVFGRQNDDGSWTNHQLEEPGQQQ